MSWPFDLPLDWPDAPDEPSRFVAYWIAHASTGWTGTPTGAQIAAGNQSNGSAAAFSGTESGFATAGTVSVDEETAITGASPGTEYTQAWVVYDTVDDAYSNIIVGTVSTAATVALSATGSTGTFAGTASSPATATLAATGETGAFSGTASADIAASLAATGNTGAFSGSAYSTATAILAATGNSGIFVGAAFAPAVAALVATGSTGTFAGTAGEAGAFDAAAIWSYVMTNGQTAEQNLLAILAKLEELHRIHGLELGSPLVVTETARQAGAVLQAISEAAGTVTVTRQ